MDPRYKVRDDNNNLIESYGEIFGSKPKKKRVILNGHNMKTDDIEGAQHGTFSKTLFKVNYRKEKGLNSLQSQDILGATANSKNRYMQIIKHRPNDPNNDYSSNNSI